ncbi:molybdopterin-dependent oxidoreductase [Chloroflexota bacterium]
MSDGIQTIPTICGLCHANCGILARVKDGVLQGIKADKSHPASLGDICPKAMSAVEIIYSKERLNTPLLKNGSGFRQVSWDEALDYIAGKLLGIKNKYGAESIYRCFGAPVDEAARDGFMQLVVSLGSNNSIGASHLCHWPREIAFRHVFGGMSQPDYQHTKFILLWGANPDESSRYGEGSSCNAVYGKNFDIIREAKKRGAKLFVIDPRQTTLAIEADKWFPITPGSDDALALAMLHVIITEEIYDVDFVSKWTVGFAELVKHVEQYTPEWAENLTGLTADDIRLVARAYATTKPALIREGNFIDQYPNAVQTTRAIGILMAITGNLDVPGGNVFFPSPAMSPFIKTPAPTPRITAHSYPLFPTVPFPEFVDSIMDNRHPIPKAVIVHHGNPALIDANSNRVKEALKKLELLVVCDIFLTATAELADVVLPDLSTFERWGFRRYASAEGGFVALRQPMVEPLANRRSVMEIEYALAEKMGLAHLYPWTNDEEWINHRLKPNDITVEDLKNKKIIYTNGPMEYQKYLNNGFKTPSGKVEIYSEKMKEAGYAPLPTRTDLDAAFDQEPSAKEKYPLVCITRRPGIFVHTRLRNIPSLNKREPEPRLRITRQDADLYHIEDGKMVQLSSPLGSIQVKALLAEETRPGIVICDFGWGNPGDNGANVNLLTDDSVRDPVVGTTSNRRFHCQVAMV